MQTVSVMGCSILTFATFELDISFVVSFGKLLLVWKLLSVRLHTSLALI